MAQSFTDNPYSQPTVADTTLGQLENNDLALKSAFSGGGNPGNAVAGMPYMRTGGIGNGLRVRNAGNTAWLKVLEGDADQKMWVYRNDTCEGWTIDATVTDRVLAFKGGSQAYNVNGGVNAGTWTFTHAHEVKAWVEQYWTGDAPTSAAATRGATPASTFTPDRVEGACTYTAQASARAEWTQTVLTQYAASAAYTSYSHKFAHGVWADTEDYADNDWRPAAAVGTLQHPDLT